MALDEPRLSNSPKRAAMWLLSTSIGKEQRRHAHLLKVQAMLDFSCMTVAMAPTAQHWHAIIIAMGSELVLHCPHHALGSRAALQHHGSRWAVHCGCGKMALHGKCITLPISPSKSSITATASSRKTVTKQDAACR